MARENNKDPCPMPTLGNAQLPEGLRVYAIGDIHGCLDQLKRLHDKIEADLEKSPVAYHRIIHCGDYVDRGPDSAGVIEFLMARMSEDKTMICLFGNHEEELLGFLEDPDHWADLWLQYGGTETLASYGVAAAEYMNDDHDWTPLRDAFEAAFPEEHQTFLEGLPRICGFGDFAFVHAGVRPGVKLDKQKDHDLTWIRADFLHDERDLGAVIVHGHTPTDAVEVRRNRINIDTGAVYGGPLTCVVVEGTEIRFLDA